MTNSWPANKQFNHGDCLVSPHGAFKLILQDDGNLVLYRLNRPGASHKEGGTKALWSSGTFKNPGDPDFVNNAIFYDNGYIALVRNMATLAFKDAVKILGSPQAPGSTAVLQDDGNFVIYDAKNVPQVVHWDSKYG